MKTSHVSTLVLGVSSGQLSKFFMLLQRGFDIEAVLNCSLRNVLCEQIGLSPQYLEEKVQTIFLDGKAIDDVDSAIVKEGATLALSSAMPGLVGATFRRGSQYASMRAQITYSGNDSSVSGEWGTFRLKLFNQVMADLGPILLERGILLRTEVLVDFLRNQAADFWGSLAGVLLNNERMDGSALWEKEWGPDRICLRVLIQE